MPGFNYDKIKCPPHTRASFDMSVTLISGFFIRLFLSGFLIPRVRVVTHNIRKLPFVGVLLRCRHTDDIRCIRAYAAIFCASDASSGVKWYMQ